jgi:hypothetical protein
MDSRRMNALGKPRNKWWDSIKTDLVEVDGVGWVCMDLDRVM